MAELPSLRIGGVPYGVGAPLLAGLDVAAGVDLRLDTPRRLVAGLRAGDLDAALVSSIEAYRRPGYLALTDLGIACDGAVGSVRLFLRTEPSLVRSLAADAGSETSVALTSVLLRARYGADIERVFDVEPTLRPDAIDADAVLLIGDAGLGAEPGRRGVLDLGEEWGRWKRLPFVFALWLVRGPRDPVAAGPATPQDGRVARLMMELRAAAGRGREQGVADGTGGRIRYRLGAADREGLEAFAGEALGLGLCEAGIRPQWTGP